MIEKYFLVQNMDECINTMLHQLLSNRHVGTFSKSKKKGLLPTSVVAEDLLYKSSINFMVTKLIGRLWHDRLCISYTMCVDDQLLFRFNSMDSGCKSVF